MAECVGKSKRAKIIHSHKTIYVCVCEREYCSKQKLIDHLRSVHGGDRWLCSICYMSNKSRGVWFTTRASLLRHCRNVKHGIPDIIQVIPNADFLARESYDDLNSTKK